MYLRTKFVDGVSTVTRHTQHAPSHVKALVDKENVQPKNKKNKKQKI